MKKVYQLLLQVLSNFATIFAITFFASLLIDAKIFEQKTLVFSYVYYKLFISFGAAIILTLFYKINRTTVLIQLIVTFMVSLIVIYAQGFLSGWFNFEDLTFCIISLACNILGLIAVAIYLYIRRKRQSDLLNKHLKNFKERDLNEKN